MNLIFTTQAQEDWEYWQEQEHDPKIVKKINRLLDDIKKHPSTELGKPETLRFHKSGYWSRRINHEHRLVYKVAAKQIFIAQCRYHY